MLGGIIGDGDDDDDFVIIMKARCLPRLPLDAAAGNMGRKEASTRASFRDQIAGFKVGISYSTNSALTY